MGGSIRVISDNTKKNQWELEGISIFDCENTLCFEQQVFKDLSWEGVKSLLQYIKDKNTDSFNSAFPSYISNQVESWIETQELRDKIISKFKTKPNGSSGKKWFKAIHHGEFLGDIIFEHLQDNTKLKTTLTSLSDWIDEAVV